MTIWQLLCFNSKIKIQTVLCVENLGSLKYLMQQFMEFFSRRIQRTRTRIQKFKPGPKAGNEDSRELRKTIENLPFNPQNFLKFLKLENNYLQNRVSLHRILKTQVFHRRLAIWDVLTNLQKKRVDWTKNIFLKTERGFFSTSVSSSLERDQKRQNFTFIDKMG